MAGYEQFLAEFINVTASLSKKRTEVSALGMGFIYPVGKLFYRGKYQSGRHTKSLG
ncbi:MAG: hypothetical protein ACFB14_10590 [Leptolyngbyaceae cyanobacterium]